MRRAVLIVFLLINLLCSTGFVGWLGPGARTNTGGGGGGGNVGTPTRTGQVLFSSGTNNVWSAFTAGSDLFASTVTPGLVTLQLGTSTCSANCTISTTSTICNAASAPVTLLLPPATVGMLVHVSSALTSTNACTLMAQGIDQIGTGTALSLPKAQSDAILIGLASGQWAVANSTYPVAQTAPANQFVTGVTNGVISSSSVGCSQVTGAAPHCGTNASELNSGTIPVAQLPNPLPAGNIPPPTVSTLGGVNSIASQAHKFVNTIGINGQPALAQPASTDLSDIPIPIASGGTGQATAGCVTANGLGAACSGVNADITKLNAFVGPITLPQGGTACPNGPTTVAGLPVSPTKGETCSITDPSGCTVQLGTAVVNGGGACGTQTWTVTFNGLSNCGNGTQNCWLGGGNAALPSNGVQVPINQLPSQTAPYNASAQRLTNIGAPTTATDALSEGAVIGGISPNTVKGTTVTANTRFQTGSANPSTAGLLNDVNNHQIVAARNAANTADIQAIGTDASNNVVVGGLNANAISLNNTSTVNQGGMTAGAFVDSPLANAMWLGSTENCSQTYHDWTVAANNAQLLFNCPLDGKIHRLFYRFYQPSTGATFSYNFAPVAAISTPLGGPLPTPCTVNGCFDDYEVTVDGVYGTIGIMYKAPFQALNTTPASSCPSGQTCYYVSSSGGNDSNTSIQAKSPSTPWASISKVETILSTLNPGDQVLFKGGDTWTASANNTSFLLGDTAAHAVSGSASKPIVIGTYGVGAAVFDETNTNPYCFAAILPGSTVQYLTIQNFECTHAWAKAVSFKTNQGGMPGITIQNMYIHDTGVGCAANSTACIGTDGWSDWQMTHAYTANTTSNEDRILPTSNNAGGFIYAETVASCTSSGSRPAFTQTPGNSTPDGTCSWKNTGNTDVYLNQLDMQDVGSFTVPGGTLNNNGFHLINNIVKWEGGHNCLELHFDTGAGLIQGNTVGPGCVHGAIDAKGDGSATNQAIIRANVVNGSASGPASNPAAAPCFFTSNGFNPNTNMLWQSNVCYNAFTSLQTCPGGVPGGQTEGGTYKIYNNTFYAPVNTTAISVYFGSATCGGSNSGTQNAYTLDYRNNIFDGGESGVGTGTLCTNCSGGSTPYTTCISDYNDIGGSLGFQGTSYQTCLGTGVANTHDFVNTNPSYVNAAGNNFSLNAGSPVNCPGNTPNGICAGLTGLTVNNSDMGAF